MEDAVYKLDGKECDGRRLRLYEVSLCLVSSIITMFNNLLLSSVF